MSLGEILTSTYTSKLLGGSFGGVKRLREVRRNRRDGGFPPRCHRRGGWGPKMRHLVLYKLVGFCHTDTPWLNGGLC